MQQRCRILSCGLNPVLLQSREEALRDAGYEVTSELSTDAAMRHIARNSLDAVVVCHSIPCEDGRLVAITSELFEVPCILLYAAPGRSRACSLEQTDFQELLWVVEIAVNGELFTSTSDYESWN